MPASALLTLNYHQSEKTSRERQDSSVFCKLIYTKFRHGYTKIWTECWAISDSFSIRKCRTQRAYPQSQKFSATHLKDFYNLGFGDKDLDTGEIDDLSVSNNNDSDRVLATVVSAVFAFTDSKPESWIYATGSTRARTRLYRMGISKYYDNVIEYFSIFGLINEEWVDYNRDIDFDAFLVKRK